MNLALLIVAYLAAVNPFRARLAAPETPGGRVRPDVLAIAIGALYVLAALGIAVAGRALDGLDVSPETFRIAAGFVLAVAGAWVTVFPERHEEPVLPGRAAALVPLLFPVLISPELFALVWSTGADEGAAEVLAALAVALAGLFALGALRKSPAAATVLRGASRLAGVVLVGVALVLVISGIREV